MAEKPRAELGATMDDLLLVIGRLTVENQLLRAELTRLSQAPAPAPNGKEAARAG